MTPAHDARQHAKHVPAADSVRPVDRGRLGRRSRTKGGAFERECATWLRSVLGDDWTVRRVPNDRQRHADSAGDLVVTGPHPWPWAIECKHVAALRVRHLLEPTALLAACWSQACEQAVAAGARPVLLAKIEGVRLCVLRREDASEVRVGEPAVRTTLAGAAVVVVPWEAAEVAAWTGVAVRREVAGG